MRIRALPVVALSALCLSATVQAQFNNEWVEFVSSPGSISAGTISDSNNETDIAQGDLDKDGWIDIVVVRKQPFTSAGRRTNILLMNRGGVLTDETNANATATDQGGVGDQGFRTETNDRDVIMVDVDNDGWLDVVTATTLDTGPKWRAHPRVYMNQGNSGGTWQGLKYEEARIPQLVHYGSGTDENPRFCSVSGGDVTGDGFADLYFGDYDSGPGGQLDMNDRLLVNDGNGFFTDESQARMTSQMLLSAFGNSVDIIDMNGDGANDIIRDTALNAPQHVSISYNQDGANIGDFNIYDPFHTNAPYHVNTGDLNNDGRPDVVVSDDGSDRYRINTGVDGLGRATWSNALTFNFLSGGDDGFGSNNMIVDLDRDGWRDIIIADVDVDIGGYSRRMHIYHNLANGGVGGIPTMREERQQSSGGWLGVKGMTSGNLTGTHDFAVFDIDNDGDKDMLVSRRDGTLMWLNQLDPEVFGDMGNARAGSNGTPALTGTGSLSPATEITLSLTNAATNSTAFLIFGLSQVNAPFKGGTLVPSADIIFPLPTGPSGEIEFSFLTPDGIPNNAQLWLQYWIQDNGNTPPFSASNGVRATFYDLDQGPTN